MALSLNMTDRASSSTSVAVAPTPARVQDVRDDLASRIVRTPCVPWSGLESPIDGELWLKMEVFQRTGSFKARGALNSLRQLADPTSGVVAFSAGNHAIATAWAARECGVEATVVMPRSANAARVARVERLGARLVLGDTIADLVAIVEGLQQEEGLALIHPFEGEAIIEGTATAGLELIQDGGPFDVVYVPIGGGGLIAGVASFIKQVLPTCRIVGVEPAGADGMRQSLKAGAPLDSVVVDTIADSLGAPMHRPYSFSLINQYVDDIVTVSDDQMREAMRRVFNDMKLAVEPACVASIAALSMDASDLQEQRVCVLACGSNIDQASWYRHVSGAGEGVS